MRQRDVCVFELWLPWQRPLNPIEERRRDYALIRGSGCPDWVAYSGSRVVSLATTVRRQRLEYRL